MGTRWTAFSEDVRREWARRYRAGESLREIARDYDERGRRFGPDSHHRLRPQVIKNNLLEQGVEMRTITEARQLQVGRTPRPCACGCGGYPKRPSSRFMSGHSSKLAVFPRNPTDPDRPGLSVRITALAIQVSNLRDRLDRLEGTVES